MQALAVVFLLSLQACSTKEKVKPKQASATAPPSDQIIAIKCNLNGQERRISTLSPGEEVNPKAESIVFVIDSEKEKVYGQSGINSEPMPSKFMSTQINVGESSKDESVVADSANESSWLYVIDRATLAVKYISIYSNKSSGSSFLFTTEMSGSCGKTAVPPGVNTKNNQI
jgi:hypothetical protein